MSVKQCTRCHECKDESEFHKKKNAKDGLQGWCKSCASMHYHANSDRIYTRQRRFYAEHPDKRKEIEKRYRKSHPEVYKEIWKRYYTKNPEYHRERVQTWKDSNPEKEYARHKRYYAENEEKIAKYRKDNAEHISKRSHLWYQRNKPRLREIRRVYAYERNRQLGYIPLNNRFEGADFHHLIILKSGKLDYDIGVHIPHELHRSIPHNRKTLRGFDVINDLAMSWVLNDGIRRATVLKELVEAKAGMIR